MGDKTHANQNTIATALHILIMNCACLKERHSLPPVLHNIELSAAETTEHWIKRENAGLQKAKIIQILQRE